MNKVEKMIIQSNEDWSFFQITVIADLEIDGKTYKDIEQRNNDGILTPENWERHKETFFTQRMAIYKDSYTLAEKIKLELSGLEKLQVNKTDYKVLKDRYKSHLEQKQALSIQQTERIADKLKVKQIALIHVYEGMQITRENAGEIAAKHGYKAKNSGEGLFQDYTNYCGTANRKGKPTPCTPRKLKNKIELFESVVEHLSENKRQRINDEIQILKTIFENEYQ